ncbi:MAG: hypothetical protein EAX81_00140 [Candidatus Thorarchaeota archaeon]|nr:hypothetical protein [Candidatus Thorarchaeota archaeon]
MVFQPSRMNAGTTKQHLTWEFITLCAKQKILFCSAAVADATLRSTLGSTPFAFMVHKVSTRTAIQQAWSCQFVT